MLPRFSLFFNPLSPPCRVLACTSPFPYFLSIPALLSKVPSSFPTTLPLTFSSLSNPTASRSPGSPTSLFLYLACRSLFTANLLFIFLSSSLLPLAHSLTHSLALTLTHSNLPSVFAPSFVFSCTYFSVQVHYVEDLDSKAGYALKALEKRHLLAKGGNPQRSKFILVLSVVFELLLMLAKRKLYLGLLLKRICSLSTNIQCLSIFVLHLNQ